MYCHAFKKIAILAFLLVLSQNIWAQDAPQTKLHTIEILGNRLLSDKLIEKKLGLKKGSVFSRNDVYKKWGEILKEYKAQGYYFARIDSLVCTFNPDSSQADLQIYIDEGNQVKVGRIYLSGIAEKDRIPLTDVFNTRPGRIFSERILEDDLDALLRIFENTGHPFCQIQIEKLDFSQKDNDEKYLDIFLKVHQGPLVRINQIKIQGNKVTKDKVIIRETRIRKGEIYRHDRIATIPGKLMKLGFFKWVNPPKIYLDESGQGVLLIELSEGRTNQFDGVLGYNPPQAGNKGYLKGLLNISFANLLGTGRKIHTYWEKKDQKTQELAFRYYEPWLFGYPVNVGIGFEQLIQDTTYVKRTWALELDLPLSGNITAFSKLGRETISPDSLGRVRFGIPKSRAWILSLGIEYNSRDDRLNPRRGLFYQTTLEVGRKQLLEIPPSEGSVNSKKKIDRKKITMAAELLLPLFRWQVLSLGFHGGQITTEDTYVPLTELFRFGGARTLRGYREDQFWGSKIAWTNLEYRYLLSRRSRAFLFLDAGYYSRVEPSRRFMESYKVGYGLGVRIETGLGIIGVDYGLGENRGLFNGFVHVGLINEF